MKRTALTDSGKWLLWLLAICLLACSVSLSAAEEEAGSKGRARLFFGLNAGGSGERAEIQAYHEQARQLARLVMIMEGRKDPVTQAHYVAGGAEAKAGSVALDTWDAFMDACSSRTGTPGIDLMAYLDARAKDASLAEPGEKAVFWFDRLSAPDLTGIAPKRFIDGLNRLLEGGETEIYLTFAEDDRGRREAFENQVIAQLADKSRAHVLTYQPQGLFETLRAMGRWEKGALYLGGLSRSQAEENEGLAFAYKGIDGPAESCLVYLYGEGSFLSLEASALHAEELLREPGEEPPAVFFRGGEGFVYFPAGAARDDYLILADSGRRDAVQAEAYLLPSWQGAASAEKQTASSCSEPWEFLLKAEMPGLSQERLEVSAAARYTALTEKADADGDTDTPIGADIPLSAGAEIVESGEAGTLLWRITAPALEIGQARLVFSIRLKEAEKSILRDPSKALAQVETEAFSVENRPPEAQAETLTAAVYYDAPGRQDKPLAIFLEPLFAERDAGQALRFSLREGETGGAFSIEENQLIIQPRQNGSSPDAAVLARDPYGEQALIAVNAQWASVAEKLQALRFRLESQKEARVNETAELVWRLPAQDYAWYEEAKKQYDLPELKDALAVEADTASAHFHLELEEGGLTLRCLVDSSSTSRQLDIHPSASYDGEALALPNLVPAPAKVETVNTRPEIAEGVEKFGEVSGYIRDLPMGKQETLAVPVSGQEEAVLPRLFTDAETGGLELEYFVLISDTKLRVTQAGEEAAFAPLSPEDGLAELLEGTGWLKAQIAPDKLETPLRAEMTRPGKAQIAFFAWDGEHYSPSVIARVNAASLFRRALLLGGIGLAVCAAIAAALIVIHEKRKPSFLSCALEVENAFFQMVRGEAELTYYGKKSVNFLALLTAAGMPPMEKISADALAGMELKPLKRDRFRLLMNGDAEKETRVETAENASAKETVFGLNQRIAVYSAAGDEGFFFQIHKTENPEEQRQAHS